MRRGGHPVAALLALALAAGLAGAAAAQSQFGGGSGGIPSFNGRRGPITLQPSDLPPAQIIAIGTGDGSATTFALPLPVDPTRLAVAVGGVAQGPASFTATAMAVTFVAPPPPGVPITGAIGAIPAAPVVAGTSTVYPAITADGTATSWPLSPAPASLNRYRVTIDGLAQPHAACSISASALSCVAAPPAGASIALEDGS